MGFLKNRLFHIVLGRHFAILPYRYFLNSDQEPNFKVQNLNSAYNNTIFVSTKYTKTTKITLSNQKVKLLCCKNIHYFYIGIKIIRDSSLTVVLI